MMTTRDLRTAAGFLAERRDYLHVHVTRSVSGEDWDVVLRLDGTYFERPAAMGAAAVIRERIDDLLGVPSAAPPGSLTRRTGSTGCRQGGDHDARRAGAVRFWEARRRCTRAFARAHSRGVRPVFPGG